jgi:hypothetical protein
MSMKPTTIYFVAVTVTSCGLALAQVRDAPFEQETVDYTYLIRTNPQARFFAGRGLFWYKKGEYDRAIADFNEA